MKSTKVIFSAIGAAVIGMTLSSTPAMANGEAAFKQKCGACHKLDANGLGPALGGIVGSQAGQVEGYTRYRSFKGADWTWTEEELDKLITDYGAYIKERGLQRGAMNVRVRDAEERAAIIEYLKAN